MFKVVNQSFRYAEWSVPYSDIFQEGGGGEIRWTVNYTVTQNLNTTLSHSLGQKLWVI